MALALSLQGKAREVALGIEKEKLNADNGVETLISELDKLFLKNKVDMTYETYSAFDKFHREENMNISDYIVEFEQRYNKCKKYEMKLPSIILAFRLLDHAGLSQTDRRLALTACSDLEFETMKVALNRIFATRFSSVDSATEIVVKEESALVTQPYWHKNSHKKGFQQLKSRKYDKPQSQEINSH